MLLKTVIVSTAFAASAFAAAPVIGLVSASGHFTLDRSEVWGNATLFDGGKIDTGSASSEAALRNGVRVQLAASSSASVSEHRLELWKGTGQVAAPESYEIDAAGLAIRTTGGSGRLRIGMGDGQVDITTLAGVARVVKVGTGETLASIAAGQRMTFAMQTGAAVTRTGCLVYKNNRYLLQDQNTQEVSEVTGNNLAPNVGNRVTVNGTLLTARPSIATATSVISATTVTLQQSGGCLSVAAALDAQTQVTGTPAPAQTAGATPPPKPSAPVGTASSTGLSTGAKVGIVLAVAGGGGAAAAIALSGGKKSTSP